MKYLPKIGFEEHYEGLGWSLCKKFIVPALKESYSYDRLTSYFTVGSLLSSAEGIDSIWDCNGKMRLVLGIHSVPIELLEAASDSLTVDEQVAYARKNVIDGVRSLTDEIEKNKIGALAMMLRDGFLKVRIAAPVDSNGRPTGGILHSKRYIFKDEQENIVVAIGSPNETSSAQSNNYEELTVHVSWEESARTFKLIKSFDNIWEGKRQDLEIRELEVDFALELLNAVDHKSRKTKSEEQSGNLKKILLLMRSSPEFAFANIAKAALFPHQERALRDAASRWPLRVLLADEVGLGKTIEAGCLIAYAKRFMSAKKIIILTPAGLRKQWQDELLKHFNIISWIYDPSTSSYTNHKGVKIKVNKKAPLDDAPDCIIVSWQLARSSWLSSKVFERAAFKPELILVDEAHSARRNKGLDGRMKTTLVWELVNKLSSICPHLVLLTATPMQMQIEEYHGLLMLLGMPDWWMDSDRFNEFLLVLEGLRPTNELQQTKLIAEGIAKGLPMFKSSDLSKSISSEDLMLLNGVDKMAALIKLRLKGDVLRGLGIRFIPPSALTVRNTRRGLESIGYLFPERKFSAPVLDIDTHLKQFLYRIDSYLKDAYGKVEEVLGLTNGGVNAFTKSIYYQRLVSSLNSAKKTLERRSEKLDFLLSSEEWIQDEPEDGLENIDDDYILPPPNLSRKNSKRGKQEAKIELQYIKGMLEDLDAAQSSNNDAKLKALKEILEARLLEGDSVLVFSRFTDTVEACVSIMEDSLSRKGIGYGCYTGNDVWIHSGNHREAADKNVICENLKTGKIKVVFCSDAASEGLNLQAARCIVNVDVPWNPARLEQRIGRIARLGQKAKVVEIYNLWFPNTVESQMYSKLLERQELYTLAVGEFPDVVGKSIRDRLNYDGDFDFSEVENTLNDLREQAEFSALKKIWASPDETVSIGSQFRDGLYSILEALASKEGLLIEKEGSGMVVRVDDKSIFVDSEPGNSDSLSLFHPALLLLEKAIDSSNPLYKNLYILLQSDRPLCLLIKINQVFSILGPLDTLSIIKAILIDGTEIPSGCGYLNKDSSESEIISTLRKAFPYRVEIDELSIPLSEEAAIDAPILGSFSMIAINDWKALVD